PPKEMFGKTMSIPDTLMREWFELLTDRREAEIAQLTDPQAPQPMEAKKTLGRDIVTFYYGAEAAARAQQEWVDQFSGRQDRKDMPELPLPAASLTEGKIGIVKLLVLLKLAASNNEARRLVQGGGVTVGPEREKIMEPNAAVAITD